MPAEEKLQIVLAVLSGELTVAEAARRNGVSEQTVGNWKRQFLDGGLAGLGPSGRGHVAAREAALRAEVEELKAALSRANVELRVWKKSAERRLPPLDDLEVIRQEAAMPVSRFCTLTGIPRRTYTRWLANTRADEPPAAETIEPPAAETIEPPAAETIEPPAAEAKPRQRAGGWPLYTAIAAQTSRMIPSPRTSTQGRSSTAVQRPAAASSSTRDARPTSENPPTLSSVRPISTSRPPTSPLGDTVLDSAERQTRTSVGRPSTTSRTPRPAPKRIGATLGT